MQVSEVSQLEAEVSMIIDSPEVSEIMVRAKIIVEVI